MNVHEAVALLRDHNEWRRGNKTERWEAMPYNPAQLGHAIDVVCGYIESLPAATEDFPHAKPCWCAKCHDAVLSAKAKGGEK